MGRDRELVAIDDFLDDLSGGFGLLTLRGPAGIGKTTLWAEGVQRARERAAVVLVARPAESETGMSFAGLADILASVPGRARAALPAPQRDAMAAALLEIPAPPWGIDERALGASVVTLLRMLAADGPVVVAVDDAQWLDGPSAHVLGFVVRRLHGDRVRFLVTVRVGEPPLPTFDLVADPSRHRIVQVGPVTAAALHEIIKRRLGSSLARPALVQITRVSGGNPFFALEIASDLERRGSTTLSPLPIPASLQGLVETKIGRLPKPTRTALLAVAASARPSIDIVAKAALGPAETAGIVSIEDGEIRFAHPLFASAVYWGVDASVRRRLHGRLAGLAADPEERARHLALAARRPSEAIAAQLDAAARSAARRGAPDAAAEMVDLALGLTPTRNTAQRAARRLAAAGYLFDVGDLGRAQVLVEQAALAAGTSRAATLQLLGRIHARRSTFAEALRVAFRALNDAGDDAELRASIELDISYYYVSLGDSSGAATHAAAAVTAARAGAEPGALADALAVATMAEFLCGHGVDDGRMASALAMEDRTRPRAFQMQPRFIHGLLLLWTSRLEEARATLEGLRSEMVERGEESPIPFLCLYVVWVCVWQGDLVAAARYADEARHAADLLGDPAGIGIALSASALVHAHEGAVEVAAGEAREAIDILMKLDWPSGTIWPRWALGLVEQSSANPRGVDDALGQLAAMLTGAGSADPVLGVFLPDEIEALVELNELERAETLTEWLERGGLAVDRPWALAVAGRCRALIHAARGDSMAALACVELALAQHDRVTMPLERARTLFTQGRVLRRRGERATAKAPLLEALKLFQRSGARLWAARVQAELVRLGGRKAASTTLTPTESLIANLAADGLSNREIADRSFITVKTVEANLTRVYRKVGVNSRVALARTLDGQRTTISLSTACVDESD